MKHLSDFRAAAAEQDIELALGALTDDVVVRSPLTDRFTFDGKDDVRRLFETAYEKFEGLNYHTVIGEGPQCVLVGGGVAGGQKFEETLVLDLAEDGRIAGITLFIRPLPGLTAVMAALGPALARRNGRSNLTAVMLRAMTAPLAAATRSGDRLGVGLALPKGRVPA